MVYRYNKKINILMKMNICVITRLGKDRHAGSKSLNDIQLFIYLLHYQKMKIVKTLSLMHAET